MPAYATDGSTWSENFTGVWHLNETAKTNAYDSHGNMYPGTLTGVRVTPGLSGKIGNSYQFAGNAGYVRTELVHETTVTISAWATSTSDGAMLWARGAHDHNLFFSNGRIFLNTKDGENNPFCDQPENVNEWHYYVTVIDATQPKASLYIDGELRGTADYRNPSGGVPFNISSGTIYDWKGKIDEFRTANVARSSEWIWACWKNQDNNTEFITYRPPEMNNLYVVNDIVTNITADSAWLNGYLVSTGSSATAVAVHWGVRDDGTDENEWEHSYQWVAPQEEGYFSYEVTDLEPDTRYYYRFMAENDLGTDWADQTSSFITSEICFGDVSDASFIEMSPGAVFVHRKDSDTAKPLEVYYSVGGTAIPGVEYVELPGVITIPANQTSAKITIELLPTSIIPKTKNVDLKLINCIQGSPYEVKIKITGEDLSTWQKCMPITFPGYTEEEVLTNFPALVVLQETDSDAGFYYNDFLSGDYGDLRFTADDKETHLSFEVELWDKTGKSYVWVRIPELTSSTTIYAFWGKAHVTLPSSNTNGSVWHAGFGGVWHLNDLNGYDSTKNNENGTLYGGITSDLLGAAGPGLKFNGVNGYIDCGSGLRMHNNSGTLSVWFKLNAKLTSSKGVIGKSIMDAAKERYTIFCSGGNTIKSLFHKSVQAVVETPWENSYHNGMWHQITAVFERTGNMTLYVNAQPKDSLSIENQQGDMSSESTFFIGAYGNAQGTAPQDNFFFPGALDEARMMYEAVSPTWISATYHNMANNSFFNSHDKILFQAPQGTIYIFW
ncbi:MAG: DUF2341 domain-containing protein [Lentisphaerae bacterium]|nr:DUF2341 domain-containing protein [Lentisphaerota bacterium]